MLDVNERGKIFVTNIDEIYDLFTWDNTYTPEEYSRRKKQGLELAKGVKYLFPFLQPFLPNGSKSVWEPCAKVIADRSDEELAPYLSFLFEWLQDLNWPGAEIILDRLAKMPKALTEEDLYYSKSKAEKVQDEMWLEWLSEFERRQSNNNCCL